MTVYHRLLLRVFALFMVSTNFVSAELLPLLSNTGIRTTADFDWSITNVLNNADYIRNRSNFFNKFASTKLKIQFEIRSFKFVHDILNFEYHA